LQTFTKNPNFVAEFVDVNTIDPTFSPSIFILLYANVGIC